MTKKIVELAFPNYVVSDNVAHAEGGMTLRDYFAAKAMQCYMAQEVWNPETYQLAARSAYRVAEAMLKERQK